MNSELKPSMKGGGCQHRGARLVVHENEGDIYACLDCGAEFQPGSEDRVLLVPGALPVIPPAPLTISEEELWGK
jgi:hypothetical protein